MMPGWLHGIGTVSAFLAFCAVCIWAWSDRRKHDFERAAQLPFADGPDCAATPSIADDEEEARP